MKYQNILVISYAIILVLRSSSVAASPSPVPQPPATFTLTFSVVERDIRSADLRASQLDNFKLILAQNVKSGRISQDQAIKFIAARNERSSGPRPTLSYQATLSFRDGVLLYRLHGSSGNVTVLYDGKRTYTYSDRDNSGTVQDGLQLKAMYNCPIPAMNLPYISIFKDSTGLIASGSRFEGQVALLNLSSGGVPYTSGTVWLSRDRVARIVATVKQFPVQSWDYMRYSNINDTPISSSFIFTSYTTMIVGKHMSPAKLTERDYSLVSATDQPLKVQEFNFANYLQPGNIISMIDRKGSVPFTYIPDSGTLDEQATRQRILNLLTLSRARNGNIVPTNRSGLVILFSLIFALGAFIIWKKRIRSKN